MIDESTLSPENQRLVAAFDRIQARNRETFIRKQLDYGPGNISDSFNKFGLSSILIRTNDKMQRLIHLEKTGAAPSNESKRDSLLDLSNYAVIAELCLDGEWPGVDLSEFRAPTGVDAEGNFTFDGEPAATHGCGEIRDESLRITMDNDGVFRDERGNAYTIEGCCVYPAIHGVTDRSGETWTEERTTRDDVNTERLAWEKSGVILELIDRYDITQKAWICRGTDGLIIAHNGPWCPAIRNDIKTVDEALAMIRESIPDAPDIPADLLCVIKPRQAVTVPYNGVNVEVQT